MRDFLEEPGDPDSSKQTTTQTNQPDLITDSPIHDRRRRKWLKLKTLG
jgi:hypothetical protein